jgi:hypothetical protein
MTRTLLIYSDGSRELVRGPYNERALGERFYVAGRIVVVSDDVNTDETEVEVIKDRWPGKEPPVWVPDYDEVH